MGEDALVTWSIEVFDEPDPVKAARSALETMQDEGSSSLVFSVEYGEKKYYVDLWPDEPVCRRYITGVISVDIETIDKAVAKLAELDEIGAKLADVHGSERDRLLEDADDIEGDLTDILVLILQKGGFIDE